MGGGGLRGERRILCKKKKNRRKRRFPSRGTQSHTYKDNMLITAALSINHRYSDLKAKSIRAANAKP